MSNRIVFQAAVHDVRVDNQYLNVQTIGGQHRDISGPTRIKLTLEASGELLEGDWSFFQRPPGAYKIPVVTFDFESPWHEIIELRRQVAGAAVRREDLEKRLKQATCKHAYISDEYEDEDDDGNLVQHISWTCVLCSYVSHNKKPARGVPATNE